MSVDVITRRAIIAASIAASLVGCGGSKPVGLPNDVVRSTASASSTPTSSSGPTEGPGSVGGSPIKSDGTAQVGGKGGEAGAFDGGSASVDDGKCTDIGTTVKEAVRQFRYPPLLSFAGPLSKGGREIAWAHSFKHPLYRSSANIWWQLKAAPVGSDDGCPGLERVYAGDWKIQIVANSAAAPTAEPPPADWEKTDKDVQVRGMTAKMTERFKDPDAQEPAQWRVHGSHDLRSIGWTVPQRDGAWVQWIVFNDSVKYSEAETLRALNAMIEVSR